MKQDRNKKLCSIILLLLLMAISSGCNKKAAQEAEVTVQDEAMKDQMDQLEATDSKEQEEDKSVEVDQQEEILNEKQEEIHEEMEEEKQEEIAETSSNYSAYKVNGLRIVEQTLDGIKLEWDELSDTEYYVISRSNVEGEVNIVIGETMGDETYYLDKEVEAGVTYYYCVNGVSSSERIGEYSKRSAIVSAHITVLKPTIEVKETVLEAPTISENTRKQMKEAQESILNLYATYHDEWDPNRDLEKPVFKVVSISFLPIMSSSLNLVVRSKYIEGSGKGIDLIEVFSMSPHASSLVFSFSPYTSYKLFGGYNPTIKMYRDASGDEFLLGRFKLDCSGASGQVGTLLDGYFRLDSMIYQESDFQYEVGVDYMLNYHEPVGYEGETNEEVNRRFQKETKSYFSKVIELNYKETEVKYDFKASYEKRYKSLKDAYEANFLYFKK